MPLRNRVDPFGELHAVPQRGALMGNRGGRFHDDNQRLGARRYMSRRWIACVCEFRGRKRDIWGALYTELFFYDEVTALAAGHRPCFECRRADAESFKSAFGGDDAQGMDRVIDAERRIGRQKRLHPMALDELPPGAMFVHKGAPFVVRDATIRQWSFSGYAPPQPRPRGLNIEAITPPSICAALANGYKPLTRW